MFATSKNGITPVAVIAVQTRNDNDDKLRLKINSTSEIDEEGTWLASESMRIWVVKFDGWCSEQVYTAALKCTRWAD